METPLSTNLAKLTDKRGRLGIYRRTSSHLF